MLILILEIYINLYIILKQKQLLLNLFEFNDSESEWIIYIQGGQTAAREPHANTF